MTTMRNDNFLDLSDPHERLVYDGMVRMDLACLSAACTCAYSHARGHVCRKCGHYRPDAPPFPWWPIALFVAVVVLGVVVLPWVLHK